MGLGFFAKQLSQLNFLSLSLFLTGPKNNSLRVSTSTSRLSIRRKVDKRIRNRAKREKGTEPFVGGKTQKQLSDYAFSLC